MKGANAVEPGSLVYDTAADKVGEYRDRAGPYVMLRPVGGGREWQADPAALRPATDRERLSAEVRAANGRTRTLPPDLHDLSRPPVPVPGCAECAAIGERGEAARAAFDGSSVTDANVLLRKHQRQEHMS
ncbi:hypothetical protein AB0C59_25000 [Streptomyces sp. NPDC048664]|uniref:hypothetical protein n=1 Tax=Streptomyces sp. NPDC048664 TaxID=3154505 RepID=UPI00342CF882